LGYDGHAGRWLHRQPPGGSGADWPRVAWGPDGRRLAAGNWDVSVSVWDPADWETVK
jgi:hypothetical protein